MSNIWVYKYNPLSKLIHGVPCEGKIVPDSEKESYYKKGWKSAPIHCKPSTAKKNIMPSRKVLETKANEIDIKFSSDTSDQELLLKIQNKLNKAP